jgi:DNA-directed RNA polymerase subunit RPC12/RpoP
MKHKTMVRVLCPCCGDELYRQVLVNAASEGIWARSTDSPPFGSDHEGRFMKCPHCSKRIAFDVVPGRPAGSGVQLSPIQKCDRILS